MNILVPPLPGKWLGCTSPLSLVGGLCLVTFFCQWNGNRSDMRDFPFLLWKQVLRWYLCSLGSLTIQGRIPAVTFHQASAWPRTKLCCVKSLRFVSLKRVYWKQTKPFNVPMHMWFYILPPNIVSSRLGIGFIFITIKVLKTETQL